MRRCFACLLSGVLVLSLLLSGCELGLPQENQQASAVSVSLEEVPAYSGSPYVELDGNQPGFSLEERTTDSFETYSTLDALGRCGPAYACIGQDLMPTEDRESISSVLPTGWVQAEYSFVDGGSLYNRCHLIGFQLTGENANEENLITGTRYMNTEGMLPFENMVAEYVQETDNHVMYRVTPVFEGDDLVASGVQMEAESVEDDGAGICFNIYVYNVQPEIIIDYSTGANWADTDSGDGKTADISAADDSDAESGEDKERKEQTYILNKNTKKFHKPECSSVDDIKAKNKSGFTGTREELIEDGFDPCGKCRP